MVIFPPLPCQSSKGIFFLFLIIHCEKLAEFQEVKLMKLNRRPPPLEFLTLKIYSRYVCVRFTLQASLMAQMVKNPPAMWETWV